jgi:hypothetical protein
LGRSKRPLGSLTRPRGLGPPKALQEVEPGRHRLPSAGQAIMCGLGKHIGLAGSDAEAAKLRPASKGRGIEVLVERVAPPIDAVLKPERPGVVLEPTKAARPGLASRHCAPARSGTVLGVFSRFTIAVVLVSGTSSTRTTLPP